jgi:PAS domain S-box-containing protein
VSDAAGRDRAEAVGETTPAAWRTILAALQDLAAPVVIADADGRPIALNGAAAALAPDAFVGRPPQELAELAPALGKAEDPEPIVLTAQPLEAALRAPEEQAESRRQLNQAQAVARIGSWTADMVSRKVRFSAEQYRLYGLEPESHVDIGAYLRLIHPEDRDAMAAAVDRAALTGEPFQLEHRLADPASQVEWIEARCQAVSSGGRVVRMVGTCLDVTERKRYERSLQDSLAEVRASRVRIVSAADQERRRVERDLHDGAQQRLVTLTIGLRLARARVDARVDPQLASMLDELTAELGLALAELRDLARGIHPAVLTEQGLAVALDSLVLRSPLPAKVVTSPERRLPAALETGVYYLVAEALTNAIKHARASRATVSVTADEATVVVEVCDDGRGGASVDAGSGLRGLADRVAALDGRLSLDSPPGGGTTLTAELPCA